MFCYFYSTNEQRYYLKCCKCGPLEPSQNLFTLHQGFRRGGQKIEEVVFIYTDITFILVLQLLCSFPPLVRDSELWPAPYKSENNLFLNRLIKIIIIISP